jgi:hypothetical protein
VAGVAAVELKDIEKSDFVLKYFRAYIADLCQQFNGGHPGYVFSWSGLMYMLTDTAQPWVWPPSASHSTSM